MAVRIADPVFGKPHVVILGAGASVATCPRGDRFGKPLPVMNDLVERLGLEPILRSAGVTGAGRNFEDLCSDLVADGRCADCLLRLDAAVRSYFTALELPENPTTYDRLVLSLREKDFIATFNWDPLLWQARDRCQRIAPVPRIVALHGSVALNYCDCARPVMFGSGRWTCERCGEQLKSMPLLYPVGGKDYTSDPLIAAGWHDAQLVLKRAYALTIFGYGAPKTDSGAIELMQQAWGPAEDRRFEEVEVIDVKSHEELEQTWRPFVHSHHWGAYPSLEDSYLLALWPRRSCEGLWNATMQNDPDPDNRMPLNGSWSDVEAFVRPLAAQEADSGNDKA